VNSHSDTIDLNTLC